VDDGRVLVQKVVNHLQHKRLLLQGRADNDTEDYLQAGYIGYLNALKGYDVAKGPFAPYAWVRIRGALLDWNRSLAGRNEYPAPLRIEELGLEGVAWELPDMKTPTAEQHLINAEGREWVAGLVQQLRESYRHVLTQYYFHHQTLKQIGAGVGLTESRICQIHEAALRAMEVLLKKRPRGRWEKEMENNKRKMFDELCDKQAYSGISAAVLGDKLGMKGTTVDTYLQDFARAIPAYLKKDAAADGVLLYYIELGDMRRDYIYDKIKAIYRKPTPPRKRTKTPAEFLDKAVEEFVKMNDLKFEPVEEKPVFNNESKQEILRIAKKDRATGPAPTQQQGVELVIRLKIIVEVVQQ
jgi:RNA polymerase sigma factor (sigma-70 family)